jgi:hypothetical protein
MFPPPHLLTKLHVPAICRNQVDDGAAERFSSVRQDSQTYRKTPYTVPFGKNKQVPQTSID